MPDQLPTRYEITIYPSISTIEITANSEEEAKELAKKHFIEKGIQTIINESDILAIPLEE